MTERKVKDIRKHIKKREKRDGKEVRNMQLFIKIRILLSFLSLLVILLLLLVNGGLGNTVQIPLAALGDAAATLVLVVLKDTNLLEGLQDLTVDGARGVDVVGGAVAAVLGRAVDLAEAVDTDGLAEVDVTGDGGGADVVPIIFC